MTASLSVGPPAQRSSLTVDQEVFKIFKLQCFLLETGNTADVIGGAEGTKM